LNDQGHPFAILRDFKVVNAAGMQAGLDHLDLRFEYA
jgi:hypothetical protein